ncbi:MAG: 3-deoxy-7-phosphoheptulonate synthase [Acidobacteria bacterium]|nr:3-deoxy-7-phosphoheptulonate synthase [Acidobacteriota bacterium]
MVIVMEKGATQAQIDHVCDRIREMGYDVHPIVGVERTVIGAIGDERGKAKLQALRSTPGVENVIPILKPFKLASRELVQRRTTVRVGELEIGNQQFVVMAGPCSVENRPQIMTTARAVKRAGAVILRGGAFKPRTSPYSFQGLEEEGLKLLQEAKEETGLAIVTEVMAPHDVELVARYADILQVGARNMQNFSLLKQLGQVPKPVLLKRGLANTLEELLLSAEYILSQGNPQVILCERGIRTIERYTRNTLDLSAVPLLRELTHLPVVVDPSHGTGVRSLILPMAKAAVAAGADGLLIEVHPNPEEAFSDGDQSLLLEQFEQLMRVIRPYVELEGRQL